MEEGEKGSEVTEIGEIMDVFFPPPVSIVRVFPRDLVKIPV